MKSIPIAYSLRRKRVWVAGHTGMVGSALVRRLLSEDCEILTASHQQLDLRSQSSLDEWLKKYRPQAIFIAAAYVGGIQANANYPADYIYNNITIAANVIHGAFMNAAEKLLFLGSSCIYPKLSPQPLHESLLLTGPLEPSNEYYAIAKIAGLKLCEAYRKQFGADFITAMPASLYGPFDCFDPERGHVIPALILKAHRARIQNSPSITIWGTGNALREFLHVDDAADALVHLMKVYSQTEHINVGAAQEISIKELARLICDIVGFTGNVEFDFKKPDGTPRKLLDSTALYDRGWRPVHGLRDGIEQTYTWFLEHVAPTLN